jgi:curved DNA-binding protein CbpA
LGLGDLVEDSAVKKAYKRASLVVHPDRTSNLSPEQRFTAKRIFDALTQAMGELN